ncbi:MAG: hypothetical protein CM15mV134_270 [uncultured marine virus]|nr:MAG: hypothetical protein CM15mV134_270 [uncultured marine virus]
MGHYVISQQKDTYGRNIKNRARDYTRSHMKNSVLWQGFFIAHNHIAHRLEDENK